MQLSSKATALAAVGLGLVVLTFSDQEAQARGEEGGGGLIQFAADTPAVAADVNANFNLLDARTLSLPGGNLQEGSVTAREVQDGSITGTDIQDGSIGIADLANPVSGLTAARSNLEFLFDDAETNVASSTLTAPADGFILALGRCVMSTSVIQQSIDFDLADGPTAANRGVTVFLGDGIDEEAVSLHEVFSVSAGEVKTIDLRAQRSGGGGNVTLGSVALSLVYIGASYGDVQTLTGAGSPAPANERPSSQTERPDDGALADRREARRQAIEQRLLDLSLELDAMRAELDELR